VQHLRAGAAGKITLCDGKTGKPRAIIDIEKAAQCTVEEGPHGPISVATEAWRTRLQPRKASMVSDSQAA
jgi:hypothetical protein